MSRLSSQHKTSTVIVGFLCFDDVHSLTSTNTAWYLWRYNPAKRRLLHRIWRKTVRLRPSWYWDDDMEAWLQPMIVLRHYAWFADFMRLFGTHPHRSVRDHKKAVRRDRRYAAVNANWDIAMKYALSHGLMERVTPEKETRVTVKPESKCCIQ